MTRHHLQGRNEQEILWFQRRDAIKAAAAWLAMGGLPAAMAQQRSNIVELYGDALLNGSRLRPDQTIQTGDQLQTGPDASIVFALGNASFRVRQNTLMSVERGASLLAVSLLADHRRRGQRLEQRRQPQHHHTDTDRRHSRHWRVHRSLAAARQPHLLLQLLRHC